MLPSPKLPQTGTDTPDQTLPQPQDESEPNAINMRVGLKRMKDVPGTAPPVPPSPLLPCSGRMKVDAASNTPSLCQHPAVYWDDQHSPIHRQILPTPPPRKLTLAATDFPDEPPQGKARPNSKAPVGQMRPEDTPAAGTCRRMGAVSHPGDTIDEVRRR
ncbi:hypothetical protein PC9H_004255 [Pleurotus ostreatus]|uniref:Uncharacterized protein n=1 Tax=Pleurotus ostreatus TaxID=5322 RepID=A0A8H7A3Z0_PLEOS|nr:uncharacterized protein PC9H_004255 [Pleurotus ostreatus]KAF7437416.1 hypothetical protein PC9H_004255 [Pleurotus ostreatus]